MKKLSEQKGQSLVEVMIALSILTVGFLGILTLLAQSLHISKTISTETTGTYLASEGIELAKSLIDHDVYQHLAGLGTGWGSCFGPNGGGFELDYTTADCSLLVNGYNNSNLDLLYYDPVTHYYLYPGHDITGDAVPSPFTRLIRVTPNGADEITVESIVSWSTGPLTSQSVDLEDDFYNWHP